MGYGNGGTTGIVVTGGYDGAIQGNQIERTKVQHRLDEQEKCLSEVFGALDALAQRLSPVLAPDAPQPTTASAPTPTAMQFTTRLSDHNRAITVLGSRIQSLLDRLEL